MRGSDAHEEAGEDRDPGLASPLPPSERRKPAGRAVGVEGADAAVQVDRDEGHARCESRVRVDPGRAVGTQAHPGRVAPHGCVGHVDAGGCEGGVSVRLGGLACSLLHRRMLGEQRIEVRLHGLRGCCRAMGDGHSVLGLDRGHPSADAEGDEGGEGDDSGGVHRLTFSRVG